METNTYDFILESAIAENTRIAYEKGWKRFSNFCEKRGYKTFPAEPKSVIEFLIEQATQPVGVKGKHLSMGTVVLYHSAINRKHIDAGLPSPTRDPEVINVLRGLKRLKGTAPRQVKALRENQIESMLKACLSARTQAGSKTTIGLRDAAIIAIGFAAALRRSEICNLKVEDVEIIESSDGLQPSQMFIYIRKSKTDQHGKGEKIAIPEGKRIKPIKRLKDWLKVSGISSGYLFQTLKRGGGLKGKKLHHSDIPRIVKYYAAQIGLDASEIAGHSLRAGFVTSAAAHHARLDKIMEVTRHRNPATVMAYIRDADAFSDHAGERFL
ncbi:MAG: tyrosine-type recombinase/integrase [Gammaproteobacteria bacterium]|nr:tyrosine-type recombinase/integrase [Gammaproteobacteria bacterium]